MTTAAERIQALKAERDRAIMWAVEMEGQATVLERLLTNAHADLAALLNAMPELDTEEPW